MRKARTWAVAAPALAALAVLAALAGSSRAASAAAPKNAAPPTITGTARQGELLSMQTDGGWSGASSIAYQWRRCDTAGAACTNISGAQSTTYTLAAADVGSTIRLRVIATNADGSASADSAPTARVVGVSTPLNTSPPSLSGTARQGQTLTAAHGTWTNSPTSYAYQWLRCNSSGGSCGSIGSRSTSASYTLTGSDVGHTIRVLVTASNAGGSGSAQTSPTAVVVALGKAPANTRAPFLSGTTTVGKTLTLNVGNWSGSAPISFKYGWLRCDTKGANCQRLAADGATYVLVAADATHTMRGLVTATNADGSSSAQTRQTGLVQGPPVATAPPAISGRVAQAETLTASAGTWASATKLTLSYQWVRCDSSGKACAPIPNATSNRYTVTSADVGQRLFVQVKGHNSYGDGFANSAQTGVVGASAGAAIPVSGIALPERLVIKGVAFTPSRITSHDQPLTARFRVTTTDGRPVSGALVYAVGIPYNRIGAAKEVGTDGNGWATITFQVKPTLTIRRGYLLTLFVRARKPGGDLLGGVSTRRLVSVRVG